MGLAHVTSAASSATASSATSSPQASYTIGAVLAADGSRGASAGSARVAVGDAASTGPLLLFHWVPETKAGKNRLHLDLYPTGRDGALPMERREEIVEAKVAELAGLGASVERRTRHDDPDDPVYYVVMHDPEGNEFCVS